MNYLYNKEKWMDANSPCTMMLDFHGLPQRLLVQTAITCAEHVSHHLGCPVRSNIEVCTAAIDAAKGWLSGTVTVIQCEEAAYAADMAARYAEEYCYYNAEGARAGAAAARAARAAMHAAWAAYSIGGAYDVYAVYYSTAYANVDADEKACYCDLIRSVIRWEDVALARGICAECYKPGEKSSRGIICLDCDKVTI